MILPRVFTVNEANALVPLLEQRMRRVDKLCRDARQLAEALEHSPAPPAQAADGVSVRDAAGVHAALEAIERRIAGEVFEVSRLGVTVKGLSPPTVDAPALRYGTHVNLSWALGERRFGHWRSHERSADGRLVIDDDAAFGDDLPQ
jgi:hypothetical protein